MKFVILILDLLLGGTVILSCFYGLYLTGCFGLFDLAGQQHKAGFVSSLSTLIIVIRLRKITASQRLVSKWTRKMTLIELEPDK